MTTAPTLHCTATLPTIGGDPLDSTTNSFTFAVDSVDSTSIADAISTVNDFYTHVIGANSIGSVLHESLSRAANACVIRCYDISAHLDGTAHGSPVGLGTFTLPSSAGSSPVLPEGVCCVGTFHSAYGSDVEFLSGTRPRARDRGRLYIGPLDETWVSVNSTTKRVFCAATRMGIVAGHMDYMRTNPHGLCVWSVWSRKNAITHPVVGGWVDDRFDYQRRREDQGVVRSIFP